MIFLNILDCAPADRGAGAGPPAAAGGGDGRRGHGSSPFLVDLVVVVFVYGLVSRDSRGAAVVLAFLVVILVLLLYNGVLRAVFNKMVSWR